MSPFWKEIYKEKDSFQTSINKIIGNEKHIFFLKG
jgi:hypothetical protein